MFRYFSYIRSGGRDLDLGSGSVSPVQLARNRYITLYAPDM